ncbi:hypothetical protein H4N55_09605 [Aeromonas veronii]|jgi:hypothetical protein|uniref:Uncharacterized protein n=1 Tax=Aeromonas simiae TaxID=218936 RepID=A0A5J6WUY2_9GAMM|nr:MULTISPECIES: hypothetical protein [Aeromonas]MBF3236859.1 hypothetical protein [Aeromonas veronii]QFI53523.1 hypothetical protein FE240_01645 [Aeromonas simiae]UWH28483.1 hypothetical protein KW556_01600 [Aeromonas veronii]WVM46125.1 hypothetical protein V0242_03350 [Aeromonas hydrophila]
MTKPLNHGAICGRIFVAMPKLTLQQEAVLLDNLDGMTNSELREYASNASELAKTPLQLRDEKMLLSLSQQLGSVSTGLAGVMNFTAENVERLTSDLKHLTETDC